MARLRRGLATAAAAAALWALAVSASGGIVFEVAGVAITSRNPRNPLIAAIVLALIATALPMPNRRQVAADSVRRWFGRLRWYFTGAPWWAEPASLVAVAGVVLQLRVWTVARPLWLDEQLIALNIRDRTLAELGGSLWLGQSAPYGWLAAERILMLAMGTGERALRLLPVLFGCATILLALWAGRRWMGRTGAFVLVLLCAFGQWMSHYPLELKHYSADAFFGLLLPVLAMCVLEEPRGTGWPRRARVWWMVAAVGLWWAYGAVFVAPACALVMLVSAWRRGGAHGVLPHVRYGLVWLTSFVLHYGVSLRHSAESTYLREYWAAGFPPGSAGVVATLDWARQQLEPLALIPGGTTWGMAFWLAAFGGLLAASQVFGTVPPGSHAPRSGLPNGSSALLAAVPLSALLFAVTGFVPMQDRLALWFVPALYFGIALLADAAASLARQTTGTAMRGEADGLRRRAGGAAAVLVGAGLVIMVSADIVSRGWNEFRAGRLPGSNHGLDDRSAARWLLDVRQSADLVMSTRLGVPALWWYGGASIVDDDGRGSVFPDGTPIVEVSLSGSAADCARDDLARMLEGRERVLFYSGFPDEPAGFDEAVLRSLLAHGSIAAEQRFAEGSRAVVVELRRATGDGAASADGTKSPPGGGPQETCIIGRPARRW